MMRLLRYLKPYLASIILIVALLFIQANADLALPDYMSRIVNTGIQQGGIEDSVPRRSAGRNSTKPPFVSQGESATILAAYDKLDPGSDPYQSMLKKYPKAGGEPLYILKKMDKSARADLDAAMSKALTAVAFIEQAAADPAKASQVAQGMGMDLSRLPPGTDLFSILPMMPENQRATIIGGIESRLSGIDPSLVKQMGIQAVKTEYERLGWT